MVTTVALMAIDMNGATLIIPTTGSTAARGPVVIMGRITGGVNLAALGNTVGPIPMERALRTYWVCHVCPTIRVGSTATTTTTTGVSTIIQGTGTTAVLQGRAVVEAIVTSMTRETARGPASIRPSHLHNVILTCTWY